MKGHVFSMRLSEEEDKRFKKVAAVLGVNVAGAIRFLVKREADAIDEKKKAANHAPAPSPAVVATPTPAVEEKKAKRGSK